ncbi:hypothetical protein BDN72DRAFT_775931 [Pluteus cervinus]|uniref:Uncharacterized protein n=1 Tax=Pluteus cervinus TaxID=181527 RepID=A0ACD3AEV9_9AGAR|nr:hypothetical protein BDN72DRAFT_775931 [Pluteus cervinus]
MAEYLDIYVEGPLEASTNTPDLRPALAQYDPWKKLLPLLIKPFLHHMSRSTGAVVKPANDLKGTCSLASCRTRTLKILCLYLDQLVRNGLFPSAPIAPKLSFSLELLDFYRAIFEQSCDAIASISAALYNFYHRRGFPILNKGSRMQDPFRKGFGVAVQWYDALRVQIENEVNNAIAESITLTTPLNPERACNTISSSMPKPDLTSTSGTESTPQFPVQHQLTRGQAARALVNRCPACFGHTEWGRPLNNGGDIHVCLDGNFHHRHQASAGDGPKVVDPDWLLSKIQVDEVGLHIEEARQKKPKDYDRKAPDHAIDGCRDSYEAADGDKKKATTKKFDDHGLVFLVCRHDIPLFFANIDTPGEQQKYAIALLLHLFSLLPPEATVTGLYDIGCVVERSIKRHGLLPESIANRLQFATSVMHAYGHQWACQLAYNPRYRPGLGLTDGEGVERLWSRLRRLIGVERSQWRSRRLWLLDRQATAIATELRNDLGSWLDRRNTRGVKIQGGNAADIIHERGIPVSELQQEWQAQREAQGSLKARKSYAPTRLKKEVESVFTIHETLEAIQDSIANAKDEILNAEKPSKSSLKVLKALEAGRESLSTEVENLYNSLNLPSSLPELQDASLEFTQTLMLARDLKINIRKRAIGSFFEWDKLDQAAGGKGQALGTKLHQQTRKAITRRAPQIVTSIRKFNKYCDQLSKLQPPEKGAFPLPSHLPTTLDELRKDSTLLEDVWTTEFKDAVPARWLNDVKTREGIRAMLKSQRCKEEKSRLAIEAVNLTVWYEQELRGIEGALRNSAHFHFRSLLLQRHREHIQFSSAWTSELLSADDFAKPDPPAFAEDQETAPGEVVDLTVDASETHYPEEQILELLDPDEAMCGDLNSDMIETQRILFNWDPLKFLFSPPDILRLKTPTSRLNDVCINDGARLLKAMLSALPDYAPSLTCAILTSWELPRIRQGCPDDILWRHIEGSRFWEQDVWILPVHRPIEEHWVCCAIYPRQRHITLFDSLGSRMRLKDDVQDTVALVKRMYLLAELRGHTIYTRAIDQDWTAQQLVFERLQHNNYDCGVWVLAFITSILRGYQSLRTPEVHIPILRERLHRAVLCLMM